MEQAWNDVENLLLEMKPLLSLTPIPKRQLEMPKADPQRIKTETYNKVYDWLHKVKMSDEYVAAYKIYRLIPPKQWTDYILYDITGLQEQILLEKAGAKLRDRWKEGRPSFFGRDYKHEELDCEASGEDGVQETDS